MREFQRLQLKRKKRSTQRNLSEEGREQARKLGQFFQKMGIPVGEVLVSPYCRCRDSALQAFGKAETKKALATFYKQPALVKHERMDVLQALLTKPATLGTNRILVSHKDFIQELGLKAPAEGEGIVFLPSGDGFKRVARILSNPYRSVEYP